jgi:hypothetical protein
MATEIIPTSAAGALERALVEGDLSRLTEEQRVIYYQRVCESLGLNPLTRPFEYIRLNGKLTLYAKRDAADQLRRVRGITITSLEPRKIDDLYVVVAAGRDASGREDVATGAVSIAGLRGEALANAMMRAETKAKRRLTLSLAGLGWTDETEIESIPGAEPERPSLAERIAARVAEIEAPAEEDSAPIQPPAEESAPAEEDAEAGEPACFADPEQYRAHQRYHRQVGDRWFCDRCDGMTQQEFLRRLGTGQVSRSVVAAVAKELYPGVAKLSELSDVQRAHVWAAAEERAGAEA